MADSQAGRVPVEMAELQVEATEAPALASLLDSIVQAQAQVQRVPHEELEQWAKDRADGAAMLVKRLRERSVQSTHASDWVQMGEFFYLQDKGCQRAAAPWGVEFEKLNFNTDIMREELPGGHVGYLVSAIGNCRQLGVKRADIGSRSSSSDFWRDEWEADNTTDVRRAAIEADVRKAAIANAYGRIVRAMTGLNGLSKDILETYGLKFGNGGGPAVTYQKGARGGARGPQGPATAKQLGFMYRLAVDEKKVADAPAKDVSKAIFKQAQTEGAALKGVVSAFIEQAKEAEKGFITWEQFVVDVLGMKGVKPQTAEPPDDDTPPPTEEQ